MPNEQPATPPDPARRLVRPDGTPLAQATSTRCPSCGAGPDRRVASGGFGRPHPVCSQCGYEWFDEVWHERAVR